MGLRGYKKKYANKYKKNRMQSSGEMYRKLLMDEKHSSENSSPKRNVTVIKKKPELEGK